MTIEEMIEVMDHKRRGGRVQFRYNTRLVDALLPAWDWVTTKYLIHPEEQAIIDHFNNGGEIEYCFNGTVWNSVITPLWNWSKFKYRIKPIEDNNPNHLKNEFELSGEHNPHHHKIGMNEIKLPEKWHHTDLDRSEQKDNEIIDCMAQIIDRVK